MSRARRLKHARDSPTITRLDGLELPRTSVERSRHQTVARGHAILVQRGAIDRLCRSGGHHVRQGRLEVRAAAHLFSGFHHLVLASHALRRHDDVFCRDREAREAVVTDKAVPGSLAGDLTYERRRESFRRLVDLVPVDVIGQTFAWDCHTNESLHAFRVERPDVDDRVEPSRPQHGPGQDLDAVGGRDSDDLDPLALEPVEDLEGLGEFGEITILLDDGIDILDEDDCRAVLSSHGHGVFNLGSGPAVDERPAVVHSDLRREVSGQRLAGAVVAVEHHCSPKRNVVQTHLVGMFQQRPDVGLKLLCDEF